MQLVADRFVVSDAGTIDLATGHRVHLVLSTVAGFTEQTRWAERCAFFSRLRHPAFATLVDYGAFAESRRFEAWAVEREWRGSRPAASGVRDAARAFLETIGRTASGDVLVGSRSDRAVAVPGADNGLRIHGMLAESATSTNAAGVALRGGASSPYGIGIVRPVDTRIQALTEIFVCEPLQRPVAASVCLPMEETSEHVTYLLARAARLAGYVPVGPQPLAEDVQRHLSSRSIVFIVTDAAERGWRRLLATSLASAGSHMAVFVGDRAVRRVYTTGPRFWTEEELVNAVIPREWTVHQLRRVRAAARRAMGSGSRFERLLFGDANRAWTSPGGAAQSRNAARLARAEAGSDLGHVRAAEPAADYAADRLPGGGGPSGIVRTGWPAPGEMTRLKHQLAVGREALSRGRHTVG